MILFLGQFMYFPNKPVHSSIIPQGKEFCSFIIADLPVSVIHIDLFIICYPSKDNKLIKINSKSVWFIQRRLSAFLNLEAVAMGQGSRQGSEGEGDRQSRGQIMMKGCIPQERPHFQAEGTFVLVAQSQVIDLGHTDRITDRSDLNAQPTY